MELKLVRILQNNIGFFKILEYFFHDDSELLQNVHCQIKGNSNGFIWDTGHIDQIFLIQI